ncbi:MAG: NAD-binding protein, partial [Bacillota bacterium]|nr:NAD-binding protein [Bacillota bacterium]
EMREIEDFLGITKNKPRRIVIFGGGLCGYYLADQLGKNPRLRQVKIFEPDAKRCEELDQLLDNALVFNCSGVDVPLYNDENVGNADVFVAVSDDDKENLFASVLAKNMGAKKTICQIRSSEYAHIVEKVGLDRVVSPSRLTADAILRFINRNYILSLTRFDDSQGQIAEYSIPEHAPCIGRPLMELDFPSGALICMLNRGDQHIIPQGRDSICAGDSILVFSLPEALRKVEILLTGEGK